MRIMLVQYAGDYREAYYTLRDSGTESYYGHHYVLQQLEQMRERYGDVAILCSLSSRRYSELLPNGVTAIGAAAHPRWDFAYIRAIMADWRPTHLVVLGPLTRVIRWGLANGCRVACQMADSFEFNPAIRLLKFGRLAPLLNRSGVDLVSNHGVNACRSLARIGVEPRKLIPWDWPYSRAPGQFPARELERDGEPSLLYVGSIQAKKGVGDAVRAVARLRDLGVAGKLTVVGSGDVDRFGALARELGVVDRVHFAGRLPNTEVFDRMRTASAVLVPSRHESPEGLPLTIYEALCARTPIVASDHPMFAGHLVNRETAMVFRAGDADELADRVTTLLGDPALYARISRNSELAWDRIQNPTKWGDVLDHWLRDRDEDRQWLRDRSLPALGAVGAS